MGARGLSRATVMWTRYRLWYKDYIWGGSLVPHMVVWPTPSGMHDVPALDLHYILLTVTLFTHPVGSWLKGEEETVRMRPRQVLT